MELILHKVCGHPAQQAVTLRRCTPDEAPAVYALQNEVHAAMPHPEWFVTDTLEHITGYITDSLCIGVWQGSRLGAYLTFHYCGQSPHNYAAFLGVPQAEWPHWANADSAVVHPDWRGNGLQRHMQSTDRDERRRAPGREPDAAQTKRRRLRRDADNDDSQPEIQAVYTKQHAPSSLPFPSV